MALPGETGGSKPKTVLQPISTATANAIKQQTKTPATYQSYSPPIKYSTGTSTVAPANLNTGTTTTYRDGDYIITVRNGVIIKREYSPVYTNKAKTATSSKTGSTATTAASVARSASSGDTSRPTSASSGGSSMPTVSGTSGGTNIGGSTGTPAPTGQMGEGPDVGAAYGWTAGLSPNEVLAGFQHTPRILDQVLGQPASYTAMGLMNPWMAMAENPWAEYLLRSATAGSSFADSPSKSDTYNFRANLLQQATTPGAGIPGIGSIMQNLASALSDPTSIIHQGIFGQAAAGDGVLGPASVFDSIAEALGGFGMMMSPLAARMFPGAMELLASNYLRGLNVNDPNANVDPATYLLRMLGMTNVPNIPQVPVNPSGVSSAFS